MLELECRHFSNTGLPRPHLLPAARSQKAHSSVSRNRGSKSGQSQHCKRRKTDQSLGCSAAAETARTSGASSSGRDTYQPSSFRELVGDAAVAIAAALEAGETRLEVEFPPVPGGVNSAFSCSINCSIKKM